MLLPIHALLNAKRSHKRAISISYDIAAITISLYFAIALRLGNATFAVGIDELATLAVTLCVTIYSFIRLGMYRAILRYMMMPAVGHIFGGVIISTLTLVLSGFFFHSFIPRSVPFIYAGLAILALGGPRVLVRSIYHQLYKRKKPNVFIYGAGSTGRNLAYSLIQGNEYNPVILLDDDKSKTGQILFGLKIHHPEEFENLQSLYQPVKLLLAINNINKRKRLKLVEKLSNWSIQIQSVPSVEDIAAGRAAPTDVKDLDIADLLGRASVEPNQDLLSKNITDKNVMVTGAGGSIGSELCRQILTQHPNTLILFELNEYNLYKIEQELSLFIANTGSKTKVIAALGSVQRQNRLEKLMTASSIETVYHAAAYKHVPLVEDNIVEGIRNNVFGTLACARAAIETGVKNFTLISTDKAVRPTNIMGASKRISELVLQSLAEEQEHTVFTMVRFGNVLGSSGSVVPLFKEQIKSGGPVTVTHPDITRYFMMIPEAAQLVIQAGAMGFNGQVFVLDMGDPVKIVDLAKRMIHLMGMVECFGDNENTDEIEIRFTGLRPGEKLYEELLIGECVEGTFHQKIMSAKEKSISWTEMTELLSSLDTYCHNFDTEEIKQLLKHCNISYEPIRTNKSINE